MRGFFALNSFSVRLLFGFMILIALTTLSAGVPAYWLTRSQLERQAWSQVTSAQAATQSLLAAEQERLANQLGLFSERPTLQQLTRSQAVDELHLYLQDFQNQSGLDILLLCRVDNTLLAGNSDFADCPTDESQGVVLLNGRPALVAQQVVIDQQSERPLGTAVAGIWLENPFLQTLTAATGTQQSILLPDGHRLASNFAPEQTAATETAVANLPTAQEEGYELTFGENVYYAAYRPLTNSAGQTTLISEVALQVNSLVLTESRAFFILAVSTLSVAVLGFLLSFWFVRQVNAPLQKLTATAEKISQGDLVAPIPLFSEPVEIRTLAAALHRSQAAMLSALQEKSEVGDRLNALVQSLVEGVATYNADGRITFWSEGAQGILGWSAAETEGQHVNNIFPLSELDEGTFLDVMPRASQKRQIGVLTKSGKKMVLAMTDSQLIPPGSDTVQVALVFRDVTEEVAVRRLRSYFLANISHEFRTPLSTMNASMELLLDENEPFSLAEVRQLLKPSHLSLLSLQNLIDNLLESSSIESGQFALRRQPFAMQQIIDNAVVITRPLLERRSQQFVINIPPDLFDVVGDSARLTQVLVNLIINASKYSPIGKPIELQISPTADFLQVGIADEGPGIPHDQRQNIFRSFVRLDPVDQEQYGIGLGLFVVKTIVEEHGGQVGVSDRPEGGSLFWFQIPWQPKETAS
ncbi:MAG: PAS domain S-box protein [Ardenticatenaceae bacterium]|nr:PAS domain S-box protein [Ardenticatenaceae bacterium]